jgi:hypothetical protein
MNFPPPNEADVVEMQHARDEPLDFKNGTQEAVMNARHVWMLDHTLELVRHAIDILSHFLGRWQLGKVTQGPPGKWLIP